MIDRDRFWLRRVTLLSEDAKTRDILDGKNKSLLLERIRYLIATINRTIPVVLTFMKISPPGSRPGAAVSVKMIMFVVAVWAFLSCSLTLWGQGSSVTVSGIVLDEAGGLIGGATVEVVDTATGFSRTTSTNGEGAFLLSLLRPSTYRITVRRSGFATAQIKEQQLRANDRVELTVKLRIGEPTEYVEVPDEGLILRSESADLGTTIGRRLAENVPLNGRSFQSLVALAPGVTMTRSDATNQGQFSVNGQRADSNYFLVDGVSANFGAQGSYSLGGTVPATNAVGSTASLVSIDALQEINVRRSTYSPSTGEDREGKYQLRRGPVPISSTARSSSIFATTRSMLTIGLPTRTAWGNPRSGTTILEEWWVGRSYAIEPFSFFRTRV
jgi:hypothetical protein